MENRTQLGIKYPVKTIYKKWVKLAAAMTASLPEGVNFIIGAKAITQEYVEIVFSIESVNGAAYLNTHNLLNDFNGTKEFLLTVILQKIKVENGHE